MQKTFAPVPRSRTTGGQRSTRMQTVQCSRWVGIPEWLLQCYLIQVFCGFRVIGPVFCIVLNLFRKPTVPYRVVSGCSRPVSYYAIQLAT